MMHFLIKYHKKEGLQKVEIMPNKNEAVAAQLAWEDTELKDHPDMEVVALDSDSLETLMKTHGRYFWVKP